MDPIITLDPVTSPLNAQTILSKDGFRCTVLTLAPGDETAVRERPAEQLLYVVEGDATIHFDDVNTILGPNGALLVAKERAHRIHAHSNSSAKVLQIEVPPRQIVTPQILSVAQS